MFVIRSPFNLHIKRFAGLVRNLTSQFDVVACSVMCLPEPDEVFYQQVFELHIALKQSVAVPNGQAFLFERPFSGLVLASAPMHGADEPAHYIVRRYWHGWI